MATFTDCGHGPRVWMALENWNTRKLIDSAPTLKELTDKLGKHGIVYTIGCLQCELASTQ